MYTDGNGKSIRKTWEIQPHKALLKDKTGISFEKHAQEQRLKKVRMLLENRQMFRRHNFDSPCADITI